MRPLVLVSDTDAGSQALGGSQTLITSESLDSLFVSLVSTLPDGVESVSPQLNLMFPTIVATLSTEYDVETCVDSTSVCGEGGRHGTLQSVQAS